MPTLTINGQRVKVDDSFLSLSPDQQNATVDEIAQSLGMTGRNQNMAELSAMSQGFGADQYDVNTRVRANLEATKINNMRGQSALGASADSAVSGATFGFDDEIGAGMGTPMRMMRDGVGPSEAYAREKALQDELKRRRRENNPVASMVGEIGGGLAAGGMLAKGGATLIGRNIPGMSKTGAAALEGAAYGGAYGAGEAESGERLSGAARGAAIGGLTGGALSKAGDKVGQMVAKRAAGPAPAVDDLARQGSALYDAATNAGVAVKPQAMNKLAGNVTLKMRSFAFDKQLQPKTAVVLKKVLDAKDKPLSISELDNIRKMASAVSREAMDASDRKAAGIIVDQIDTVIDDAANFSAGSGQALQSLKQAREVWKRKLKLDVLTELQEKAQNQATGYENGLVIQLRSLANNKKRLGLFSKEEQALIKSVVRRPTAHGVLRAIGMLSPNSTFGGIATGGAVVGTGIIPGAAMAGTGFAARKGAEALTRGKFNQLVDTAARGGSVQGVNKLAKYVPLAAPTATQLLLPYLRPELPPTTLPTRR